MADRALVIMAAGRGSRFGGLKQIADMDGRGHRIIDYSVYDAHLAGFSRVVLIVGREGEAEFRQIGRAYSEKYGFSVDFVLQDLDLSPFGFTNPKGRSKPWGTAHAVASLSGVVTSPFALINADDFYGRSAFRKIHSFLVESAEGDGNYAMVGYRLKNTLSKNGSVSRGICRIRNGYVDKICEMGGIRREGGGIVSDGVGGRITLSPESTVSVNMWGFTPDVIDLCRERFSIFLAKNLKTNPLGCEFYLPSLVSELIDEGVATVRVLDSDDGWQGVTYREDVAHLKSLLRGYVKSGLYPKNL